MSTNANKKRHAPPSPLPDLVVDRSGLLEGGAGQYVDLSLGGRNWRLTKREGDEWKVEESKEERGTRSDPIEVSGGTPLGPSVVERHSVALASVVVSPPAVLAAGGEEERKVRRERAVEDALREIGLSRSERAIAMGHRRSTSGPSERARRAVEVACRLFDAKEENDALKRARR